MNGEITFDLEMINDMPFIEGCYRIADGEWHVFMFRKHSGVEDIGIKRNLRWDSGVTGINIIVPDETELNKQFAIKTLSDEFGINTWVEVSGPDSMQLR